MTSAVGGRLPTSWITVDYSVERWLTGGNRRGLVVGTDLALGREAMVTANDGAVVFRRGAPQRLLLLLRIDRNKMLTCNLKEVRNG
jgi:hypothetical protein